MSTRRRTWVMAAVASVLAGVLGLLSRAGDWSRFELYTGLAVVIVLVGLPGMFWIELARDGAFGRKKHD